MYELEYHDLEFRIDGVICPDIKYRIITRHKKLDHDQLNKIKQGNHTRMEIEKEYIPIKFLKQYFSKRQYLALESYLRPKTNEFPINCYDTIHFENMKDVKINTMGQITGFFIETQEMDRMYVSCFDEILFECNHKSIQRI